MVDDVQSRHRVPRLLSPRDLHSRGLLFPLVVAAVVGVVLLQGFLHRAAVKPVAEPELVGPPAPPEILRRPDLEKAPLDYHSEYWQQLGERVRPAVVLVGPRRHPAIVVAPGLALGPLAAADGVAPGESVPPVEAEEPRARLIAVDPDEGLALFGIEPADTVSALTPVEKGATHAGELTAAVSLSPEGRLRVAPGYLVSGESGSEVIDISLALPQGLEIAAVVDLDAKLVGLAVGVGGDVRILSAPQTVTLTERLQQGPRCEAIEVAELSQAVRRRLGIEGGVLVERVREAAFASPPPIRPGDVVRRWNGQPVAAPPELRQLMDATPAGQKVVALVQRGRASRSVSFGMPADCRERQVAPLVVPALGLSLEPVRQGAGESDAVRGSGWRVVSVAPDEPGAASGLEPEDRLLAIDGLAVAGASAEQLRARLSAGRGRAVLTVRRGDRVALLPLAPPDGARDGR